ncbi:MAG TPA: type II toxin-antitoxin system VapB family antitoxin [Gammaproteobacteria bacterium]|nr:type II toxin-antitoxin system VapB family antitoxin [Gammaproteobacteria bacterium]
MNANLAIDIKLLEEAQSISGLKTKKETVNSALKEFVNRRKQMELTDLFGKYDTDSAYDYKKARKR